MTSTERVVAGWILEERLGSGGFGEVWKAHRRHGSPRALKLIRIGSQDAFDAWRHEISRLENLSHPNIVRFYDADVVTEPPYDDHAWIATELCGRSLADELHRRDGHVLAEAEVTQLLDEMLAALATAHASGCVHRDVKPANILRHDSGVWKLCDFGTARLLPTGATHPHTQVVGTSPYMSAAAHSGRQDHGADLYALGVTVHEALCGQRLHPRVDGISDTAYAVSILKTPPTVATDLPGHWSKVVEVLIGRHGSHTAAELALWFERTRGARAPRSADTPTRPAGRPPGSTPPGRPDGRGRDPRQVRVGPSPSPAVARAGAMVVGGAAAAGAAAAAAAKPGNAPGVDARPAARTAGDQAGGRAPEGPAAREADQQRGPGASAEVAKAGPGAAAQPATAATDHYPATHATVVKRPPPPVTSRQPAAAAPSKPSTLVQPVRPAEASPQGPAPASPPVHHQPNGPNGPAGAWAGHHPPPVVSPYPYGPTRQVTLAANGVLWPVPAVTGRRLLSWLLDAVLIGFLIYVVLQAFPAEYSRGEAAGTSEAREACASFEDEGVSDCFTLGNQVFVAVEAPWRTWVTPVVVSLLVTVVLQGLTGVTPGKLLVGLRTVRFDGQRPGMLRALGRWMFWLLDALPLCFPLFGLIALSGSRGQRRIGDRAVGTWVVPHSVAKSMAVTPLVPGWR